MSARLWLQRPYPFSSQRNHKLIAALAFGSFVTAFLLFFAPFGTTDLGRRLFPVAIGYGAVTVTIMVVLNGVVLLSLKSYAGENQWTVGKEIAWTTANLVAISFGNLVYSNLINISDFTWLEFGYFLLYTVAIGCFPLLFIVYLRERQLRRHYEKESGNINQMRPAITASKTDNQRVTLISNNQNENLALPISELLYVAAAENYCDVFYLMRNGLHKKTLRIGISAIENQLNAVDATFFRCHKSFIVNRAHVKKVSGNAQGYKLHLKQTEITIPVSRKWNHSLREELAIRQ